MIFYKTRIIAFISLIFFSITLESQIIDIETSRKENLIGNKLSLNLGFDGSSGTVDRTNYSLGTRFDFNNKVWNRFLIFNYSRREKDERINEDNTFLHLRFARKISSLIAAEFFIQTNEKPLEKIEERNLIGLGLRFSPVQNLRLGIGIFDENEKRINLNERNTVRVNTYLNYLFNISSNTSLNTLVYFQPDSEDFSEIRSLLRLGLRVNATENFFININYEYVHDSSPPFGTDKKNSIYGFKIGYEF
ncbi:MAG: hypothetical protein CL871_04440 [Cytophagia bacterium]|nr:hypothetical protein [Cytophagia bacterium]|tara:strand:+ start:3869 stop:4612 length:744 start_codon:yes stop_codon:yes gene_type:complete